MGYPQHYLLSFGGPLGLQESWSCSLRMTNEAVQLMGESAAASYAHEAVESVAGKVEQYMDEMAGLWQGAAKLGFVKFNLIGEDGKYRGNETAQKLYVVPRPAAISTNYGPFQLSCVVSLETGVQRGLAVSGRYFLPTAVPVIDAQGKMTDGPRTSYVQRAANFVNNLNNWAGPDLPIDPVVSVVSRGKKLGPNSWGPGLARPVTRVAVGNVLDTQRRRREQLREEYLTAELA